MTAPSDSVLVLFPGALGDFICVLPTVLALRAERRGALVLVARPALLELADVAACVGVSIDRREVADLFTSGAPLQAGTRSLFGGCGVAWSWSGFGDATFATRLAEATGGAVRVFPFRDFRPGEHAVDYYARCAAVAPRALPASLFRENAAFLETMASPAGPLLVVQPGSGSPRKNWQGFAALAEAWRVRHGGSVVVLCGPVELETGVGADLAAPCVTNLSLPQVVALLRCATAYVGNDSGVSHLAGALGTPTVVVFGDTDPRAWAPRGPRVRVLHAPGICATCGAGVLCVHRVPVEQVVAAVGGA